MMKSKNKIFSYFFQIMLMTMLPFYPALFSPVTATAQSVTTPTISLKNGQLSVIEIPQGKFLCYHPQNTAKDVLVVVHGTPDPNIPIMDYTHGYISRWTQFAEYRRLIVIAPIFDENYGAGSKTRGLPGDGYRGLFGVHYSADYFVNSTISSVSSYIPNHDGRFLLYGHSAGGQFVSRYLVCHPQRVRFAIISAAGRFAFPDAAAPWPYGMASAEFNINGSRHTLSPNSKKWLFAAMTPVAVIVGDMDTEPQPARPGHIGPTRIDLAKQYVESMKKLAAEAGQKCPWQLHIQPGVGHSSARLTPSAQRLIGDYLRGVFQ